MRQKVFHCLLQNLFAGKAVELEAPGNAGRKLNQHVIEKRNAALDGGRHAHVVLLHQQLDQISLDIRIKQALQHFSARAVPMREDIRVRR